MQRKFKLPRVPIPKPTKVIPNKKKALKPFRPKLMEDYYDILLRDHK